MGKPGLPPDESGSSDNDEGRPLDPESVSGNKPSKGRVPATIQHHCMRLQVPRDPLTIVEAKIEVRLGNALYIRGQGDGLSWDKGQPLSPGFGGSWIWKTNKAKGKVLFRLLLNDEIWAKGEDGRVDAGKMIEVVPVF